ncbi:GNAT family N-acetyltransferase [Kaistella polysaccharea]|uniref:GNAT family N-acetyltransferase n=1 Tax=Kaistella polysaccharea TaxID=2878534 RepID=UPI001CF40BC6|nr:GNAT family N-acetyltransferase [Kaistella polysaccharea]
MITFKEAKEEDISLIQKLADKSWKSAYQNILSADQITYMVTEMYSHYEISWQILSPNYLYYIILNDEIGAGFMGFELHYEEMTTKLHRIYLLEEFKGKGIGKKALDFLKTQVRENKDHRIILNVNKNNPAKSVYESQGFQVYDEQIFDIGNGFVMDDFLMELHLV